MLDLNSTATISTAPASDVPRISREMGMVQKMLSELNETTASLEQRLQSVLRPAPAQNTNGQPSAAEPAASPMTHDLEDFRRHIERLVSRHQDLLGRLEI